MMTGMFKEKRKARNKMLRALMCLWYYIRNDISPGEGMFLAEN